MLAYWIMYLFAAVGALLHAGRPQRRSSRFAWSLVGIFYILLIGFRMSGGDWYNYLRRFEEMSYLNLDEALQIKDVGYQLLSYYIHQMGWGFLTVTMICAGVSIFGLLLFLRRNLNPWLGLAVAVPYLITVVYMGYMRQGVALGLVLWGISELQRNRFWRFVLLVVLATTFHKSAIMMIAFGVFAGKRGRFLRALGVAAAFAGVWAAFVGSGADVLWQNYVEAKMQSQGAMIRALLNTLPALLLFVFAREWKKEFSDYGFWRMIALASFATIFLVKFASTAVDRMALYFIPLQLIVYMRLPYLARRFLPPRVTTVLILLFYALVYFVWLNYAANSRFWLPYRNFLTSELY
jgi:hypothetical protein